jgi:hypothetical protein
MKNDKLYKGKHLSLDIDTALRKYLIKKFHLKKKLGI